MMRDSTSLRTTFFGMPIPVPVMIDRMCGEFSSPISPQRRRGHGGKAKKISVLLCVSVVSLSARNLVRRKRVLPPAELANDFLSALIDHRLQLVVREERERGEGALAGARAAVFERDVERRVE